MLGFVFKYTQRQLAGDLPAALAATLSLRHQRHRYAWRTRLTSASRGQEAHPTPHPSYYPSTTDTGGGEGGGGRWVRSFAAEAVAFLFRSAPDAALPAGVRALLQEVEAAAPPPDDAPGWRRRAADLLSRDERVAASAQVCASASSALLSSAALAASPAHPCDCTAPPAEASEKPKPPFWGVPNSLQRLEHLGPRLLLQLRPPLLSSVTRLPLPPGSSRKANRATRLNDRAVPACPRQRIQSRLAERCFF